jgi:hypothetical protein
MSPHGYGGDRLRGVKRSLDPEVIITVLLEDWLRANGYLRTTSAVEATVAAAIPSAQGRSSRRAH